MIAAVILSSVIAVNVALPALPETVAWSPVLVPETVASSGTVNVLEVVPPAIVKPVVRGVRFNPLYVFPVSAEEIFPSAIEVPFHVPVPIVPNVVIVVCPV